MNEISEMGVGDADLISPMENLVGRTANSHRPFAPPREACLPAALRASLQMKKARTCITPSMLVVLQR
jgi:hypothetical protein